jgi:hypothetical protein
MRTIITNAFSLNMLSVEHPVKLIFTPLDVERVKEFLLPGYTTPADWESAVGHPDTEALFTEQLGQEIPVNRSTLQLEPETRLIVGQYTGPRLEPGAKTLPEGATISWWLVSRGY